MMADATQPRIQANMVIHNIGQLVTLAQQPLPGAYGPLQVIDNAAMAVLNGNIVWIGREGEYEPMFPYDTQAPQGGITLVDAQGAVITPGLVDSFTPCVFAGGPAEEFHVRRCGVSS